MATLPKDPTGRYACPCCGYFVFLSDPDGSYSICPICWWEVESDPLDYLDEISGPNHITLREGRENFEHYRISDLRLLTNEKVMKRLPKEVNLPRFDWIKYKMMSDSE